MLDIKKIEEEAQAELNAEFGKIAKGKIMASMRTIKLAEKALANARAEHAVLMRDIGAEVGTGE